MRLSIQLNPLAALRRIGGEGSVDLLKGAVAADLSGLDGIVCQLDSHGFVTKRDLATIRQATSLHMTVEIEPVESLVLQALELKPDQITFVPSVEAEFGEGLDLSSLKMDLRESVRSIRAAGVDTSVLVSPSVANMKEARKMELDFVTLSSFRLAQAGTTGESIDAYEEFESAALGANKLGLRVIAQGAIDHRSASILVGLGTVEELVLDHRFLARSFLVGLEKAVSEVHAQISRGTPRSS